MLAHTHTRKRNIDPEKKSKKTCRMFNREASVFSGPFLGTLINVNWGSTDSPRLLPKTQNQREPKVKSSEIPIHNYGTRVN